MATIAFLWLWEKIFSFLKTSWDKIVNTVTQLGGTMRRFMRRMRKKFVVGTIRVWRWAYPKIARRVKRNRKLVFHSAIAFVGIITLLIWVQNIESKMVGIPFARIFKWMGLALAGFLAIWLLYKMTKGSSSKSSLRDWKDELKAVFGYIILNIAFGLVWPEAYVKVMTEYTLPFIGTHIFFIASIIMLASSPRQAEKIGGLMKGAGLVAVLFLALRLFGVSLEPWNWSWADEEETEVRYAGAELTAEKLPSPAWQYFDGPEKELVMTAFPADTVMWAIAACESRYRQFGADGEVLRGDINPRDIGLFQINEEIHSELIKGLVEEDSILYDIRTSAGNIAVAKVLANRDGYQPWSASAYCWQSNYASRPTSVASSPQSVRGVAYTEVRRDSAVFVPAGGGWSAPVGIPPTHFLSNFTPARSSDSLFIRSPSGKVYVLPPNGKVNMDHEVGRWRFRISDTSSVDMEVYVTRAEVRR